MEDGDARVKLTTNPPSAHLDHFLSRMRQFDVISARDCRAQTFRIFESMTPFGPSRLLYEQWYRVASANGNDLALIDFSSGKRWSFAELLQKGEEAEAPDGEIIFLSGNGVDFILGLVRAWKNGRVACPLDASQTKPRIADLPSGIAHVKLTSASSGHAKCVLFTAQQLAADPAQIISTMGLRRDWPNLGCISLAHSYGFSNLVLPLLLHGIPLMLVPAPLPRPVMEAAFSFSGITLAAVPALWKSWHESDSIPGNVRIAISAGAPLAIELEEKIYRTRGLKIHNFYGSSECGGIAYDRSEEPRREGEFAGTALDGVTLSLSAGGTLVVEGRGVAETYWPDPQSSLSGNRFETSDIAEVRDGAVYLRGRLTDVINVAGRKAVPEVIEAALRAHPSVKECVVFGCVDSRHDRFETIVACINTSAPVGVADLAKFLSESLPTWQIPRQWWFNQELTPNERGKISRAEWRQRFTEQPRNSHGRLSSPLTPSQRSV